MKTNTKKSEQLGMPIGTASSKLRKIILFDLLKRHEENICYRCGESILTVEELSIDHKEPWLGFSTERFWDTNNIAFSHLKCNVGARRNVEKGNGHNNRPWAMFNKGPEGTLWCGSCCDYKPISEFHHNRSRKSGYEDICGKCCLKRSAKNDTI